jgi:outer membrane lipoprotein-sorting protein
MLLRSSIFTLLVCTLSAQTADEVLSRMNRGGSSFQGMNAKLRWTDHTKVINEDSTQSGTVRMKKGKKEVAGLIDYTQPDPKTILLRDNKVQIFYPKIKTVQIYDLGKRGDQLYQFLLLGFGTTADDLRKNYEVTVGGQENLAGRKTIRLVLVPRSKEAKDYLTRIELWIPEDSPYPMQEKLHHKSGDYTLIAYSDLQINPPLADKDLELQLPQGVKKEYPQK